MRSTSSSLWVGVVYMINRKVKGWQKGWQSYVEKWAWTTRRNCRNCRNCRTVGLSELSDCRMLIRQVGNVESQKSLSDVAVGHCRTLSDLSDCRTCRTVGLSDCRNTVGHCRTLLSDCRTTAQARRLMHQKQDETQDAKSNTKNFHHVTSRSARGVE